MAIFIKLLCGSKIREAMDLVARKDLRTSDLDDTVKLVFNTLDWQRGILASFKTEAIKGILRDRVHTHKVGELSALLEDAVAFSRDHPNPAPEIIELKSIGLQKKFPSFDLYEIRYILKAEKTIRKNLISGKWSGFDEVHNAAKKELYASKEDFRKLNRTLSKTLGFTETEIDQKIYHEYFGEPSTGKTHFQIQRILDSINPSLRQGAYQALFGNHQTFSRILEKIDRMSKKDAVSLNNLLKNGFDKDIRDAPRIIERFENEIGGITSEEDADRLHERLKEYEKQYLKDSARALNHWSEFISLMHQLGNNPGIENIDVDLKQKIANKWAQKFGNLHEAKSLFSLDTKKPPIENSDTPQPSLNDEMKKFISKVISENANRFGNSESGVQYLKFVREKYRLHCATLEQTESAMQSVQPKKPKKYLIRGCISEGNLYPLKLLNYDPNSLTLSFLKFNNSRFTLNIKDIR